MTAGRVEGRASEMRGAGMGWPLFGGWLPLIAVRTRPSRADGGPWDGVTDPGYRATLFVVGWFGRALSVVIGTPRPASPSGRSGAEAERLIRMLDDRIDDRRR